MPKFKDLRNLRFGKLVVISRDYEKEHQRLKDNKGPRIYWICKCDCGNQTSVQSCHLLSGHTTSCGCVRKNTIKNINIKYKKKKNKFDLSGKYGIGWTSNTNKKFYFDIEDYDQIKDICWYEKKDGYICETIEGKQVLFHRFILGLYTSDKDDFIVDHKEHNIFDNRKEYLRITSHIHNSQNRGIGINNSSGVTGVCWKNREALWIAYISVNYKQISLGKYHNLEDAITARKQAEEKYFGEWSYDNSISMI